MGLTRKPYIINEDDLCSSGDSRPILEFGSPRDEDIILTSPVEIYLKVDATSRFESARLEYGPGTDPAQWEVLENFSSPITGISQVHSWDVSELPTGWITLRLYMKAANTGYAEKSIRINIQVPTPTPTATASSHADADTDPNPNNNTDANLDVHTNQNPNSYPVRDSNPLRESAPRD